MFDPQIFVLSSPDDLLITRNVSLESSICTFAVILVGGTLDTDGTEYALLSIVLTTSSTSYLAKPSMMLEITYVTIQAVFRVPVCILDTGS